MNVYETGQICSLWGVHITWGLRVRLLKIGITHNTFFYIYIVYRHGCTWRYEFNARKSGVLVYENPRKTHGPFTKHTFRLGREKVGERTNYDHVGIRASPQVDDVSGIAECISKRHDTFNAAMGLGIRKNGLSMATCNIILWNLVVPAAMYGCELWFLSDECNNLLESIQLYVCKRIQRFYAKVPYASSLYALGWMRLERYVQVRKLLFIRSIMILDNEAISKRVFCLCATRAFNSLHNDAQVTCPSIARDLLKVARLFGLLSDVMDMVNGDHFYPKLLWKNKVLNRAWALEDVYWRIEIQSRRSLDLLRRIDSGCRYLSWWFLSDTHPAMMYMCENLSNIVCHASLLKTYDVRLKRLTLAAKFCKLCNLSAIDDANHLVMQCPALQVVKNQMFDEIRGIPDGTCALMLDHCDDVLSYLIGRQKVDFSIEQMVNIWKISGKYINVMYGMNLRSRKGIG